MLDHHQPVNNIKRFNCLSTSKHQNQSKIITNVTVIKAKEKNTTSLSLSTNNICDIEASSTSYIMDKCNMQNMHNPGDDAVVYSSLTAISCDNTSSQLLNNNSNSNNNTDNSDYGSLSLPSTNSRSYAKQFIDLFPVLMTKKKALNYFQKTSSSITLTESSRNHYNDLWVGSLNSSNNSINNNNTNTCGSTGVAADQRHLPQLRIRARYQSLGILPLCNYWPLRTLILSHSLLLTKWLESLLSVKFKEEIANSLVCLHEHNNTLIDFLTNLVVREVSNLENDSMAFRSNTMATKAVECYVKFVGSSYLHQLLHLFIQRVLTCFTLWEVDPDKLTATQCMTGSLTASDTTAFALSPVNMLKSFKPIIPGSLISNQIILLRYFDAVWRAIQSSLNYFPRWLKTHFFCLTFEYLHQLLHLFIQRVLTCFTLWEVDPEKLTATQCMTGSLTASDTTAFALSPVNMLKSFKPIIPGSLISNQIILLRYFDAVWRAIQSSLNYFPSVLIDLFSSFRRVLEKSRGSEFCDNLISSCIFLRLICPALLSPSLFGLISAFPSEPACQRNLTLLAKSLQTLANFSTFDDKEPYMRFLNGYVTSQLSSMRSFIRSISTSLNNDHTIDKVNIVHGSDTNIEATTGISNAVSDSLSTTNADQMRSTLTTTSTTTAKATSQNNIKDTIDESCELANLHVILSDVIFRDTLTTPSVTITNNTHTNTNANTTAPAVNTNNGHNGITTDAHEVNSSTQGIVSPIFLYLHQLLHLFIQRVLTCFTLWEVDPDKLTATQCMTGSLTASDTTAFALTPVNMLKSFKPIIPGSLISNQIILLRYFDAVWRAIQSSLNYFPSVLIELFSSFRTVLEKSRGSEFCDNLISSCIFLRLICPALLSPSLFGLISAFPSEPACQRNLTLLAKSLQTLANFSTFDDKEPYMRFLNGYVTSQLSSMRSFIRSISTSLNNDHTIDKVNIVHGSDTNIEATTGISNAVSDSLSTTNADQTRSTLTATLSTSTTATTAKATSQNNIKDTIDESCELANLHVILSDVIFRDSLITPSVTITYNTHTNTNANTTAPDVNTTNGHNGITTDAHEVNSSTQGIVSPIFLKPVCPTIVTSLPEELCSLPRILDDISRALQQITSSECKQYDKTTTVNHTHTILMNTNDQYNSLLHHRKGGSSSSVMQSNISPSSSSPKHHKSKKFVSDREQPSSSSLSPVHHIHHHSHQHTSVAAGGGNTPYYTVHYNPGFHNPDSCCKVGLNNNNATNTATTTTNSTGLLLPQLKQSASLTGLPSSDVSRSNPNDYDEPYMSPESDCDDIHETGVNSDHEVISKKAQTISSSCITSKPVCPTIVTSLPEELCSLPRILDDISRALQQITSNECKQYDKTTSVSHTHTIVMNTNNHYNSLSHHQKGGSSSSIMQSNISPSSSSPKHHKSKKFDHDREQPSSSSSSLSPVHHSHQYTSVAGGGNTSYYTVHYNPGFHNPVSCCKVGLNNNNATNTTTTTTNSSTGLLLPQLKQSASLTGLPSSDVSQSNPNDYDEPYMSPESDCDDIHETGVNSDHEVISKKAQTISSSCITSTFQSYSSSLSIANNSSLTTNYNVNNNKTNGYSSKDKKIYDHKSISLDKLNNSDNEHIYDMVPLSSSSASSPSASPSSPSASPSREALHHRNGVNMANDSYIHQPDQVCNCNNDSTLTSMNHVTLNIEKDNDSMIQTKTGGDAVNSNIIIEQTPTSLSSSSLTALSNKITTSNENVQYNHHHHHHHHGDEPDVVVDDEINKFNQRNVCKSISPKLFLKKQVTTANVILTKPNVMSSSSIDTTKISKLTATTTTHFRSNSSSRENMFDSNNNINGDHFSFGASNTVQVNLTPHSPTHKVYNTNPNNNINNTDNPVDNFICRRQHTHRKNASSEELYSYTHSENSNYDMHDTAAVVVDDDVDVDEEEENSTTSTTVMNSMKKPNRKQPSELAVEIALLRYELLLSRQDALRAADRLSKQETEIYQLRQLLEQLRNNNNNNNDSKKRNQQSIELKLQNSDNNYDTLLNTTHVNDEMMMTMGCSQHQGSDPQLSSVKLQNNTRVGDGVNNSCLQNPSNTHSKVLQSVTATFKELDDAMARLELEQSELLREQARIRARIAATHRHQHQQQQPITSCTQSTINPTVSSKSKSLIRPKYFQSSIPKILIDSEKSRELPSPGHMNYVNSPRTNISNNNYIQKTSICSELKSAPKK
ncbi:unnamed protein product [Trichobilharzia szidati]|nr:unnamed protein product [Trichobilharzia szidati]